MISELKGKTIYNVDWSHNFKAIIIVISDYFFNLFVFLNIIVIDELSNNDI
jgi:hypothetical protein